MPLGLEKLKSQKSSDYPPEKQPEDVAPVATTATTAKEKEAPPSYAPNDPISDAAAAELNAAFVKLKLSDTPPAFPEADHCLAHLKLLSTFHSLKEDIGYTDGLFGLWDARCELVDQKEEALANMREKRWSLYIARAVERFEAWWLRVLCPREGGERLKCKDMTDTCIPFAEFTLRGQVQQWTPAMLPPVGKLEFQWFGITIDFDFRCSHGLARLHPQSSQLS
jgi:hypothetical protein